MITTIPNNKAVIMLDSASYGMFAPYLHQNPYPNAPKDVEKLHCTYIIGATPIKGFEPNPEEEIVATITGALEWYNSYLNTADLVVTLSAPELFAKRKLLEEKYGVDSIYKGEYVPHLTLQYGILANNRNYRWFYNEVVDTFNGRLKGTQIKLSKEALISSAGLPQKSGSANAEKRGDGKLMPNTPAL